MAGDYATSRTDLFTNLDDIDVLNRGRVEGTIWWTNSNYGIYKIFLLWNLENYKGHYYGQRLYNPSILT